MKTGIHIGTSGYSFRDWIGTVYPTGTKPADFISRYAKMFDCVEINTTYYHVPPPSLFANMLKKVSSDFIFVTKLPKEFTHDQNKCSSVILPFRKALEPLLEADQLGALLAQFPFSFKPSKQSRDYIAYLAHLFEDYPVPTNIEFRHSKWYSQQTCTMLKDLGLGFVNVDLPTLTGLPRPSNVVTSDTAYYRFHGRNARMWWKHPTPSHRYDYLYSDEELNGWITRIKDASSKGKATYVFTNNCHLGQSVVNALQLHKQLSLAKPSLPPGLAPEMFELSTEDLISQIKDRIAQKKAKD
jgi:uncharacterized protein YecE (DUF72 family)